MSKQMLHNARPMAAGALRLDPAARTQDILDPLRRLRLPSRLSGEVNFCVVSNFQPSLSSPPATTRSLQAQSGRSGKRIEANASSNSLCRRRRQVLQCTECSIHVNEFVQGEDRLAQIREREVLQIGFRLAGVAHQTLLKPGADEGCSRFQFSG